MTTDNSEGVEVLLERTGGVDMWLMPLSLIGCVLVLGPLMALGFDNMPSHWIHDQTVMVATVLTAMSGVVLLCAYLGAKKLVTMRHRLLRVEDDRLALYNRKGTRKFVETSRQEVEIQCRNWIIEGPSGRHVSPVLRLRAPETQWLTMTVDNSSIRWDERVGECEDEAEFSVSTDEWHRLVKGLGLQGNIVHESTPKTAAVG